MAVVGPPLQPGAGTQGGAIPPPDFDQIISQPPSVGSGSGGGQSKMTPAEAAKAAHQAQLTQTYMSLWGLPPPPGYVERAAGMNIFEFEAHERSKSAFRNSPRYLEESRSVALALAQRLGGLG